MNYFTPERVARLQERSDEQSFLTALDDWERALEKYKEQWQRVRVALPDELQGLLEKVYLHDARILDMWWGGRSQFTITLHPESDPSRLVVLTYSLVVPPQVENNVLPESARSKPIAWLYDELDLKGDIAQREPVFTHQILLSDGREVLLLFRNVTVKRPVPLVPVVPASNMDQSSVKHSA
jgi:hypothetical protein